MSKYARVLNERVAQREQEAPSPTDHHPQKPAALFYRDLIEILFPRNADASVGKIIAFTSYSPGEGVSYVVQSLAAELGTSRNRPTVAATADCLMDPPPFERGLRESCLSRSELPNVWTLSPRHRDGRILEIFRPSAEPATTNTLSGAGLPPFEILRHRFAYALIDCRSLKNSDNISKVAASCDGVILVIEADRTRPDQIELARRAIEASQGTLVGCVLNQRKYPIPDWLYRHM